MPNDGGRERRAENARHESVNEKAKRKAREMRVARAKRRGETDEVTSERETGNDLASERRAAVRRNSGERAREKE